MLTYKLIKPDQDLVLGSISISEDFTQVTVRFTPEALNDYSNAFIKLAEIAGEGSLLVKPTSEGLIIDNCTGDIWTNIKQSLLMGLDVLLLIES